MSAPGALIAQPYIWENGATPHSCHLRKGQWIDAHRRVILLRVSVWSGAGLGRDQLSAPDLIFKGQ